jgi:hypothetical protein
MQAKHKEHINNRAEYFRRRQLQRCGRQKSIQKQQLASL